MLIIKQIAPQKMRGGAICETRCAACKKPIKHAYEAFECVVDNESTAFTVLICNEHTGAQRAILASYIEENIYGPTLHNPPDHPAS